LFELLFNLYKWGRLDFLEVDIFLWFGLSKMFGFGSKLFEKFLSFLDGFVDFLFEFQAFDGD
jgi:hypothetical protein